MGVEGCHFWRSEYVFSLLSFISSTKACLLILPDNGTAISNVPASKVMTFCHKGDNICVDGLRVLQQHLTYGLDARNAANFVIS